MSADQAAGPELAPDGALPFGVLFADALRGVPVEVVGLDGRPRALPVERWGRLDDDDRALVALCDGPTLDIGCGPGRMAAHLAERGLPVLGLDLVPEAVAQTRARGVPALLRDVFSAVPGEGRWGTALLADGNVGIGGDPVALLRRAAELVTPGGRLVLDLDPPGTGWVTERARLRRGGLVSRPFRWARVGLDAVAGLAGDAGLEVRHTERLRGADHADAGERWAAVLGRPPAAG